MHRAKYLRPNLILDGNILQLTPEIITKYQLKGLVLDVDDTLLPISSSEISPEIQQWFTMIREYAVIWLLSNNFSDSRISRIATILQVPYVSSAAKPSRRKLKQVLKAMNLEANQIAMVGDRPFTDIIVGNRLGLFTILVEPMLADDPWGNLFSLRKLEVTIIKALGFSE